MARANPKEPFHERLLWLSRLVGWIKVPARLGGSEPAPPARDPQATRLLHLLNVLDRNLELKQLFAATVRSILREIDALELFSEIGLPREPGFWGEAKERLLSKLLPQNPYRADLGSVLRALFAHEGEALWVAWLDGATLHRLTETLAFGATPEEGPWHSLQRDLPDALLLLSSDLRSLGLSSPIRRRLDRVPFRDLPFFDVVDAAEAVVAAWAAGDLERLSARARDFSTHLDACRRATDQVYAHLDEFGVSVKVLYTVEKMRAQIRRSLDLVELLDDVELTPAAMTLLVKLVRDNTAGASISALANQNLGLLAKKVVDRSAETGAHYIARNPAEYRAMLRAAAGGGAMTAFTTAVKFVVSALPLAPFQQGLLASLNYSVSFVAIQLAHFTLATKQPAMTAPALAAKMHRVESETGLGELVDETARLLRTQIAGVIGNVGTVVPVMALIALALQLGTGLPYLKEEKAHHTIESLSLFSATPIFAAFTGVLLWLSSLAAGWADNAFVLRHVDDGIVMSPRLCAIFGPRATRSFAAFLRREIAGLAGSVSLGLLLGLVPVVCTFLGVPLDVRHVTLSSGALAASVVSLGWRSMLLAPFWEAVAGIAVIGALNLSVSFGLAMAMALRASEIETPSRRAILRALTQRLVTRPQSFLLPEPETPPPALA